MLTMEPNVYQFSIQSLFDIYNNLLDFQWWQLSSLLGRPYSLWRFGQLRLVDVEELGDQVLPWIQLERLANIGTSSFGKNGLQLLWLRH